MTLIRTATAALAAVIGSIGFVSSAFADTFVIVATADGQVVLQGGNPGPPSTTGAINQSQNVVPGQEIHAVYEFDLPSLTDPIVSATFLAAVVQNSFPPGEVSFFGFSGNGTIDSADATQTSNLIGSTSVVEQLGSGAFVQIAVPLSASFVAGLGSGFLGITTTVGTLDTVTTASLENTNPLLIHPTLMLETQGTTTPPPTGVPEPGSMLFIGSGLAALVASRRNWLRRPNG